MEAFAVVKPLFGGILIGCAASGLLLLNGRIAGISNVFASTLHPWRPDSAWRLAFIAGLLTAGVVLMRAAPEAFGLPPGPLPRVAIAGLLVGLGTTIGNGCTSGHGVCGLARRSKRSLVATATFMGTGALTVFVANHVLYAGGR